MKKNIEKNLAYFMNLHNLQDSLKDLTDYLSLSKNTQTLLFAQHTHLGLMLETHSTLWMYQNCHHSRVKNLTFMTTFWLRCFDDWFDFLEPF